MAGKRRQVAFDDFDLKILDLVQRDNQMPQRLIADRIGLSPPAVARRLQHLRETGIIQKDIAVIDEAAAGRPLTIIVEVTTENERRCGQCEELSHLRRDGECEDEWRDPAFSKELALQINMPDLGDDPPRRRYERASDHR